MKKIISLILSLILLLSTFTMVAYAGVGDTRFDEKESNNSYSTADPIKNDYTVYASIKGQYDMDYFKFTLSEETEVLILSTCKYKSLLIGVYDSSDELVAVGLSTYNNGYYHNTLEATLSAGTYYILALQDSSYSNLTYLLYLSYEEGSSGSSSSHTHSYTETKVEATCETDGYTTYVCSCGESYDDDYTSATGHEWSEWEVSSEEGKEERSCFNCGETEEREGELCAEHNYVETAVKATMSADGSKSYECSLCGDSYTETISKISSVKLSYSTVVYNGKAKAPGVIVLDEDGAELEKGRDFTVTYEEGRKQPGEYSVKVKFTGDYKGEKTLKFTVTPKTVTGLKASKTTSTAITLKWSKTAAATGYKVYQYSSGKGKYVLKKTVKNTTYKASKLKSSTSYKFKIRAYTKADDGSVILGDYSKVLTVKTKKGNGVEISGTSATLTAGKTKQLKAVTTPSDKKVTWKSNKKSVATVSSSGKVTAKKPGTATITASFEYKGVTYKDTYKVTVKAYLAADKTKVTVKENSKKKVIITIDKHIENISGKVVEGSNAIDFDWGEWDGYSIPMTIRGENPGTGKIKVYDKNDEDNCVYINVTVKPSGNSGSSGGSSNSGGNSGSSGDISDVLSAPIDSLDEIKSFVDYYYARECYYGGNFRFVFNSADGVILSWGATNLSNKDIKYITFTINYYNRVGDPAYDSITRKSSYTGRLTGPIGAGKSFYVRNLIGYGGDIYYGVMTDVKIEFMDGSVVSGNYGYTTWHNSKIGASPKECYVVEE